MNVTYRHHRFPSDLAGAAAIVISAFEWLLLVRGIFLMAFPDAFASVADRMIGAVGVWLAVYAVFALVGLYVT